MQKTFKASSIPVKELKYNKEHYLKWYESMVMMRKFEEKCGQLYIQQKFGGFCHLYIGQESILAGMITAIEKDDNVITAYRDHAFPLALGTDPRKVMAEMYGKQTGTSKGKGGSMHMFDKEVNLFGGHGIVGAQIPLGAGIAFAEKYKGTKNVTLCFMGDGATRQGALHETFNMAMTWTLPVIFVIENNHYAMGTSVERTSNVHDLYRLGLSYDMPSLDVDGMRVEDVADAFTAACKHVRAGKGPVLLEMDTYRYKGHSMSDPGKYRSKEELDEYISMRPISRVRDIIIENKWFTNQDLDDIDAKMKDMINECVQYAEDSPYPHPDELYIDVYQEPNYPFIKD